MSNSSGSGKKKDSGYKNPPEHSRWAKGRSGNPGGRPKKQELECDDRLIALVEAQVPQSEHIMLDLMLKAAIKASVQGDVKALRFLLENYQQAKRRRRSTTSDDASDRALVERMLETRRSLIKELLDGEAPCEDDGIQTFDEPDPDE